MNIENIVLHVRNKLPGLLAVYLFGSQATGQADASSDLDIAILAPRTLDPMLIWELAGEIADIAHVPVDLIDLRGASTVMQYQVITQGRRLWAGNELAGLFEAFVLSEKTALDSARSALLEDIRNTGIVYGR